MNNDFFEDDTFVDEELEDYTDQYYALAGVLSELLNIHIDNILYFITRLNPNSILYEKLNNLSKALVQKKNRREHRLGKKAALREEKSEYDRSINAMTMSFLPEITEYFSSESLELPKSTLQNIDSFLYLINSTYFQELYARNTNQRREFLIEQLLGVISLHFQIEGNRSFTEEDAKKVLSAAIFIPADLKDKIYQDFASAKVGNGLSTKYEIVRNDIVGGRKSYLEAKRQANKNRISEWDINLLEEYDILINGVAESPEYRELDLDSAYDLSWDTDFLQQMIKDIDRKHRRELILDNENYSTFALAYNLVFEAMVYAKVNGLQTVDDEVLLKAVSTCEFLPVDLRKTIVQEECVVASGAIGNTTPYEKDEIQKTMQKQHKIIQFHPKNSQIEE